MKLTQKQLRHLIESIVNEAKPKVRTPSSVEELTENTLGDERTSLSESDPDDYELRPVKREEFYKLQEEVNKLKKDLIELKYWVKYL